MGIPPGWRPPKPGGQDHPFAPIWKPQQAHRPSLPLLSQCRVNWLISSFINSKSVCMCKKCLRQYYSPLFVRPPLIGPPRSFTKQCHRSSHQLAETTSIVLSDMFVQVLYGECGDIQTSWRHHNRVDFWVSRPQLLFSYPLYDEGLLLLVTSIQTFGYTSCQTGLNIVL